MVRNGFRPSTAQFLGLYCIAKRLPCLFHTSVVGPSVEAEHWSPLPSPAAARRKWVSWHSKGTATRETNRFKGVLKSQTPPPCCVVFCLWGVRARRVAWRGRQGSQGSQPNPWIQSCFRSEPQKFCAHNMNQTNCWSSKLIRAVLNCFEETYYETNHFERKSGFGAS